MKIIIHLALTDEQRALFNNALCKTGLVSRKEVTAWVNESIERLLTTQEHNNDQGADTEFTAGEAAERTTDIRPETDGNLSVPRFVPSRGDEPYLYKPKNPELAASCSAVLSGLKAIENFVWNELERNRL